MNNKSWQEISTNKKGEKQYYIVGVGTVSAPISSPHLLILFKMLAPKHYWMPKQNSQLF